MRLSRGGRANRKNSSIPTPALKQMSAGAVATLPQLVVDSGANHRS